MMLAAAAAASPRFCSGLTCSVLVLLLQAQKLEYSFVKADNYSVCFFIY